MPAPAGVALRSEKLQSGGFALSLRGKDIATALAREGLNSKLGQSKLGHADLGIERVS